MKFQLIALVLLSILFYQCEEGTIETPTSGNIESCELRVYLNYCPDADCSDPTPVVDKLISIYKTRDDLNGGLSPIAEIRTDENGQASIAVLECEPYLMLIDDEIYGQYITEFRLEDDAINHHTIIYVEGFTYDANDKLRAWQEHISLVHPRVGQVSKYKFHSSFEDFNFIPDAYEDSIEFRVKIIDYLGYNQYLVSEEFNTIPERLIRFGIENNEPIENIWEINEDSIHIYSVDGAPCTSFVWNISGYRMQAEEKGYSFPIYTSEPMYSLDFENDEFFDAFGLYGIGTVSGFTLLDQYYVDNLSQIRSYISWDGPQKVTIYSKENGVIRWFNLFDGGPPAQMYGLDLEIE